MPSIRLQKDKLVTEIFTAVLQKDKSNPVLYDPIFDLPLNSLKRVFLASYIARLDNKCK